MEWFHGARWLRRASTGLVVVVCTAAAAPFETTATTVYRDTKYKFSLYRFDKWEQVPVEVDEKYTVAKFYEPGSKGDAFRPEMEVLRLNHKPDEPETPSSEGPDPKKEKEPKLPPEIAARLHLDEPKSIYDVATRYLINFDEKKYPSDKNWKPVVSKDKVNGKFWAFEIPFTTGRPNPDETLLVLVVGFEKDGVEYGIRVTTSARRRDTYEPLMKGIAKSFLFFDDKAKDVATLSVLDGINLAPERRKQIEEGLVKGWDVIVSPKKNYVVVYNTKNDTNKELARVLADRIEKIREQVYEKQFPPAKPVDAVSVMRVCGDAVEYHAYGGPGGSAGYWNNHSEELVFYDASRSRKVDDDTLYVLYHEAFHQYIYYSVGSVSPHSWFNEGHGDYYAGAKYGGSKFTITPFRWRIGVLKTALNQGPRTFKIMKDGEGKEHKVWGNTGYTPLKDLVEFSQGDYYSYPSVSYAQGWSLIYFLREEVPKKKEWNAKWGKILSTYFDTLKREAAHDKRHHGFEPPDPPKKPPTPPTHPTPPPTDPSDPTDPKDPKDPKAPADPKAPKDPGDPPKPGDEPGDPGFQPMQEYGDSSPDALKDALTEAFRGVDFAELEQAWLDTMKHVN